MAVISAMRAEVMAIGRFPRYYGDRCGINHSGYAARHFPGIAVESVVHIRRDYAAGHVRGFR